MISSIKQTALHAALLITLGLSASAHAQAPTPADAAYKNPATPTAQRVDDLLARMTLEEKIGQMTQAERQAISPENAARNVFGSILSGGGSAPKPNTPQAWADMIRAYQDAARSTRLGIPILYGIDAVHGHQSVVGATIFPHLLGLGATRDAALMARIGQVTAQEMAATGIFWNFSPMIAVSEDIRWGRAYESFSEDTALVSELATAYAKGMMQPIAPGVPRVIPTAKHFIGDGGTAWKSAKTRIMNTTYLLDQGDTQGDSEALLARYLPPYKALFDAGVGSAMASFSSWNGNKVHGERALLTGVLKERLGFKGFLVSDWDAIQQLPGDFSTQIAAAINAGIDMAMVPNAGPDFARRLKSLVESGKMPQARIDDAVRRILTAKFTSGVFDQPYPVAAMMPAFGSAEHRAVAREAVAKTLTLLKNKAALPIDKNARIFVAGSHADNIGAQSGGWSLEWQGVSGNNKFPQGTSLLAGLKSVAGEAAQISFDAQGKFQGRADIGLIFLGESPYAEGIGDRYTDELALSSSELSLIESMRERADKVVLVLVAGRPIILDSALNKVDALVMAWLPGTEGAGVADVLFGDKPFTGRLPVGWPATEKRYQRADATLAQRCPSLQWAIGFGLDASGKTLGPTGCDAYKK